MAVVDVTAADDDDDDDEKEECAFTALRGAAAATKFACN